MKNLYKTVIAALVVSVLSLCSACEEFVTLEGPPNLLVKKNVFEDERSATATLLAIYSDLSGITSYFNGNMQLVSALNADELVYMGNDNNFQQFAESNILQINAGISNLWRELYRCIYMANAAMEGLEQSEALLTSTKEQLMGEALLVRAICYHYLVELYGGVPLIKQTDYEVNQSLGRERVDVVYDSIVADLLEARELLSPDLVTVQRTRPNRYTASALLARVYLYRADWLQAEKLADEVISSGIYLLVEPESAFLKSSEATIFQLQPVYSSSSDNNTNIGRIVIPTNNSIIPSFCVSDIMLTAFEPSDRRGTVWLSMNKVNDIEYIYPFKYKLRSSEEIGEYLILFRLPELLLIRAEARLHQGNTVGAVTDINTIRENAGLTELKESHSLFEAIKQERRIELAFEWCHRWLDLKRWDLANEVLAPLKGANWSVSDTLWPVPFAEIQANPFLTQNEGYIN